MTRLTWLVSLLKLMVGRVKDKMENWFVALANIYIPLAFILFIFGFDKQGWIAWGFFGIGVMFLVAGVIALQKSFDKFKERDRLSGQMFLALIEQIRGLRQDLKGKGEKDGNNKSEPS